MDILAARHPRVMLGTSTARIGVVKVYLDFGFVPEPRELADEKIRAAWQALQAKLNHDSLARCLSA